MDITARLKLIADMQGGVDKYKAEIAKLKEHAKKEGKGLGAGLSEGVKENVSELGGVLKGALGVGSVVAVAESVREAMEAYDAIGDTATKLGESAETVQRVGYAAKLSGSSIEGLAAAFLKLEKNTGDEETTKAREALERYGLSVDQVMSMPLDQKILAYSEAFERARAGGSGYKDLLDMMGKSAGELIPLLMEGKEGIQEMFGAAVVIDDAGVKRLGEMNDAFDGMVMKMKALTAETVILGDQFLKLFENLGSGLTDYLSSFLSGQSIGSATDTIFGHVFAQADDNEAAIKEAEEKQKKLQEQREARAKAMQEQSDKAVALKRGNEQTKAEDMLDKIRKSEIAAMPEGERLGALDERIQAIYATMDKLGGQAYEKNQRGLEAWAASLELVAQQSGKVEDIQAWEKVLAIVSKVRDAEKERTTLNSKLRDDAAKTAEDREKQQRSFKDSASSDVLAMLPDKQKREAILAEMKGIFERDGLKSGDLRGLDAKIRQAQSSGDLERAAELEKDRRRILSDAKSAAQLGDGQMAQRVGGAQNLINILTGKGANQLGERQLDTLKDVLGVLTQIRDKSDKDKPLTVEDLYFN